MFLFLAAPAIAALAIAAPAAASPIPAAPAIAAQPLPVGSPVSDQAPAPMLSPYEADTSPVENFDPLARASLMAQELPRSWSGSYQSFGATAALPADLQLSSVLPMGQMVVLRGALTIAGVTAPVQGNLNAKSDQLDLLLLGGQRFDFLEAGGDFQGLQGLELSGWNAPRLTSAGGRLQLQASSPAAPAGSTSSGQRVRGLW